MIKFLKVNTLREKRVNELLLKRRWKEDEEEKG